MVKRQFVYTENMFQFDRQNLQIILFTLLLDQLIQRSIDFQFTELLFN